MVFYRDGKLKRAVKRKITTKIIKNEKNQQIIKRKIRNKILNKI